jgi:hypothetical protein
LGVGEGVASWLVTFIGLSVEVVDGVLVEGVEDFPLDDVFFLVI